MPKEFETKYILLNRTYFKNTKLSFLKHVLWDHICALAPWRAMKYQYYNINMMLFNPLQKAGKPFRCL